MDSDVDRISFGGMTGEGNGGMRGLVSRVFGARLGQLGFRVDSSDIFRLLSTSGAPETGGAGALPAEIELTTLDGGAAQFVVGRLGQKTEGTGSCDRVDDIVAHLGTLWKIKLSERRGLVSLVSMACDPESGRWVPQDLPNGAAAKTVFTRTPKGASYVARETHHTRGLVWDPSLHQPADVAHYPGGQIRWVGRHVGGARRGRGRPRFESFWPNGQTQTIEYGEGGDNSPHRRVGPAYQEFYPDGRIALSVVSHSGGKAVFCEAWGVSGGWDGGKAADAAARAGFHQPGETPCASPPERRAAMEFWDIGARFFSSRPQAKRLFHSEHADALADQGPLGADRQEAEPDDQMEIDVSPIPRAKIPPPSAGSHRPII